MPFGLSIVPPIKRVFPRKPGIFFLASDLNKRAELSQAKADCLDRAMTAAERQRVRRLREALGLVVFRIELPEHDVTEALIECGYISDVAALDQKAVERALGCFLNETLLRDA